MRRSVQPRASVRPTKNAALAPSTLATETSTTPRTRPKIAPAATVRRMPGTMHTVAST